MEVERKYFNLGFTQIPRSCEMYFTPEDVHYIAAHSEMSDYVDNLRMNPDFSATFTNEYWQRNKVEEVFLNGFASLHATDTGTPQ